MTGDIQQFQYSTLPRPENQRLLCGQSIIIVHMRVGHGLDNEQER